jgi:tmRNA-binding protein
MKLTEKVDNLLEANIRYTVFKIDGSNNLKDRQELNNLGELNTYLSKANGNYAVIGIKDKGAKAKFVAMNKGSKHSESPINKNQHSGLFNKIKETGLKLLEATIYPNKGLAKVQLKQAKDLQKKHKAFDKDSVDYNKFRELQMLGGYLSDIIDALEEFLKHGSTNVEMESKFIDGVFNDLEKLGIK